MDGGALRVEQPGDERGQQHEQHQRQPQTEDDGKCHHQRLQLLRRDVLFQPLVELAGLGILVVGEIVRREHQRLDACDHGADERHSAPEDGNTQNGIPILDKFSLRHLGDQSLRRANHDGVLLRAAHENSFNQRLSADGGAEGALFLFHMPE